MNLYWNFVVWLAEHPSRALGVFCLACCLGIFGGYATRRRR